jgi:hypothetical protein
MPKISAMTAMKQIPAGHANPNHASHSLLSGQGLEELGNAGMFSAAQNDKI